MKDLKNLAPADLMDEGNRWVIAPGDYVDGKGFRVEVIFENHPFRFPIGEITNLPGTLHKTMPFIPADDHNPESQRKAQALANEWCLQTHGIDTTAYLDIISSSIKAYELGKRVKVLAEHPDHLTLMNGFGDEIHLDEESAITPYQDLAETLDLPCQRNCPKCGGIMEDDQCEECADPDH